VSRLSRVLHLATGHYVPFLKPFWNGEEESIVSRWRSGERFLDAPLVLQHRLVEYLGGNALCQTLNLGRSAIQVGLAQLAFSADSEVILPAYSCAGVIVPVLQAGLRPVLADVGADLNPTLENIKAAYSENVKAVIVPHLAGVWNRDMDAILAWAAEVGVIVIEDATQSLGLRDSNQRQAGTLGDLAVFSTGGGKPAFGPGGGMLVSRNKQLASVSFGSNLFAQEPGDAVAMRLDRFISRYRASDRHAAWNSIVDSISSRMLTWMPNPRKLRSNAPAEFSVWAMADVEAKLALAQLDKVDEMIRRRRANGIFWRGQLASLGFCSMRVAPVEENSHTKFWVSFVGRDAEREAEILRRGLWKKGVETEPLYTPLHLRSEFSSYRKADLSNTESIWRTTFSLPARPNLTDRDRDLMESAIKELR